MKKCNFCTKQHCEPCSPYGDMFIPIETVRKFFTKSYIGVNRGIDGYTWDFNTTNPDLKETSIVIINGREYCSYCTNVAYPIQEHSSLNTTGYCCICEGALAELDYKEKELSLVEKHEKELNDLKNTYKDRLKIDTAKLFKIKQSEELREFKHFAHNNIYTFNNINGEKYADYVSRTLLK